MTENRAGPPRLSISISSIYLPIMYLSFYPAISLSSISLPFSPFIHPSIPRIYPFISPINQLSSHRLSAAAAAAKSLQSCPTLCDPRDGSAPGSPVPGILQARMLERVAISFSNA